MNSVMISAIHKSSGKTTVTLGLSATASEINTPLDGASVTLTEFQELEAIGATTISATQWGYLGAMDQGVTTSTAVAFPTIDTGFGANELYDMNQNVQTTDTPQFARMGLGVAANGSIHLVLGPLPSP